MPLIVDPSTAGYSLTTLLTEFYARGYDYLNDAGAGAARATRWINQAYFDICAREPWEFLETDASGTAPLTITDLRAVLSVTNTTQTTPLPWADRRDLLETYGDLTTAGTATCWYRASSTSLALYPANTTDVLAVRYLAKPALLTVGADQAVIPTEWCDLIVDGAVLRAKKDNDDYDNYVAQFEADLAKMVRAELLDGGNPGYITVTGSGDW